MTDAFLDIVAPLATCLPCDEPIIVSALRAEPSCPRCGGTDIVYD